MSVKIMGRVFDFGMPSNRKFVLLTLGNYADDDGRNVFPSVSTISEKTGIGERTVGRILSEFRQNGVINQYEWRKGKRGRIPVYHINIDRAETVFGLAGNNPAMAAGSREKSGESNPAPAAVSQNRNPANENRLPATGDTTPCHSLADDSSGTVSKNRQVAPPIVPPVGIADELEEAVKLFNELAARIGLAKVQNFSDTRRRKLRKRLAECGGLEGWSAALAKVEASTFLTGGGRNGWKASFDFMLQASKFTRILEGYYDNNSGPGGSGKSEIQKAFDRLGTAAQGGEP